MRHREAFSISNINKEALCMDEKTTSAASAEYEVSGTKYIVTPVYNDSTQKEALEDKVKRLILSDKARKE